MKRILIMIVACALSATGQSTPVTIFLAGDSTMAAKAPDKKPEAGWGEMLESRFKPGTVKVDNRAMNGRSTTSFIAEGRWKALIESVSKGDYVFIQFGHNDQKKDKPGVYAPPEQYRANLANFVKDVREKGANPILLTSIARRRYEGGRLVPTHGDYPGFVREAAKELNVPLIDMERRSDLLLVRVGEEESKKIYLHLKPGDNPNYPKGIADNTHLSTYGAGIIADLAIDAIKDLRLRNLANNITYR